MCAWQTQGVDCANIVVCLSKAVWRTFIDRVHLRTNWGCFGIVLQLETNWIKIAVYYLAMQINNKTINRQNYNNQSPDKISTKQISNSSKPIPIPKIRKLFIYKNTKYHLNKTSSPALCYLKLSSSFTVLRVQFYVRVGGVENHIGVTQPRGKKS